MPRWVGFGWESGGGDACGGEGFGVWRGFLIVSGNMGRSHYCCGLRRVNDYREKQMENTMVEMNVKDSFDIEPSKVTKASLLQVPGRLR